MKEKKMDANNFFQMNRASTARMKQIAQGLSAVDLQKLLPNGWTIAGTLAHLAFWDQKVIHTIDLSNKENKLVSINFNDSLNDILAPILEHIAPLEAVKLAVQTAETLDAKLENCPSDLFDKLEQLNPRWVDRSLHRNDHLNDIESFLKVK
jgi:hypothetical protein